MGTGSEDDGDLGVPEHCGPGPTHGKELHEVTRSRLTFYGDLARAIKQQLVQQALLTGDDGEPLPDQPVGHAPSSRQFVEWSARRQLPYRFRLVEGLILMKEWPCRPHGNAIARIIYQLSSQDPREVSIIMSGDEDLHSAVLANSCETPDVVMSVNARGLVPHDYPVVVSEVGVSQSPTSLIDRAHYFLSAHCPTVIFYVALKRYDHRLAGDQGMIAYLFERNRGPGTPARIISFGTGPLAPTVINTLRTRGWDHLLEGVGVDKPCTSQGIPRYELQFPTAVLFQGVPGGAPAGAPPSFHLDLFIVQQAFQRKT